MTTGHEELDALLAERARTMADFTDDHRLICMYAIYRSNLKMTPEKMASQCGHAFTLAMEEAKKVNPNIEAEYKGTGNGTKLIMHVKNQGQLLRAYDEAKALGLNAVLVVDRGHVIPDSEFTGAPVFTAIGIGPCFQDEAYPFTRRCTMG